MAQSVLAPKKSVSKKSWLLSAIGLIFLIAYLFPIYWMVVTSFKSNAQSFSKPPQFIPNPPNLDAWSQALSDPTIVQYLTNSLIVGSGTAVFTLVIAMPGVYALTHLRFRAKGIVLAVNLCSLMFPAVMLAMPLYQILARVDLLNSYVGLILANATLTVPFALLLMRPLVAAIPRELVEASRLDGAGAFKTFWSVILPLSRPAMVMAGIFAFLLSWGDLVFAITLTKTNDFRPITAGLWNAMGNNITDWAQLTAMASIGVIPAILIFLLSQRFVVAGLGAGALKD